MDFKNIKFKDNGKLKLLIIVGTRPEIIRLSAVITKCRKYFDTILAHTGQNYDYNLNGVFFKDLKLEDPEVYLNAVGADLGETMGNIIASSYQLMVEIKPDAVLVLGDTNSCLSVIGAKRLHIPIFHMEAGNRCKDECLPEETNRRIVDIISDVNMAYSEHARRYLADCGLPKERTYVTGSPMAEVLHNNLAEIEASDIHARLGLEKGKYILLSAHREENTIFCKIGKAITLFFCLLLILQPLFADGQALNADAGQAGAWAMLYRYGSIGVAGLWTACLLMPRRVVRRLPDIASFVLMGCVIWEAVVALDQLYGDGMSNHALYGFTGTFLNPGPFSGFLAIGVPLAVTHLPVISWQVCAKACLSLMFSG